MPERLPAPDDQRALEAAVEFVPDTSAQLDPVKTPPALPAAASIVRAVAIAPGAEESTHEEETSFGWQDWWQQVPSWMASTVFHLAFVLLLAFVTTMPDLKFGEGGQEVALSAAGDGLPEGAGLQDQMMDVSEALSQVSSAPAPESNSGAPESMPLEALDPALIDMPVLNIEPKFAGSGGRLDNLIGPATGTGRIGDGPGSGDGTSLELRLNPNTRLGLVQSGGGSPESEKAVANALHWLAEHQNYDGSWTYQHQKSPKCHGACEDPGNVPGRNAATAMALLPFLGTGQTHLEGQYKRNIDLGLKYLMRSMVVQGDMGSFHEPVSVMYGHGLAAIVLTEAYGMTHDRALEKPAQLAINYIIEAQDPEGGGWRYEPRMPGDTSVVGWQLMALRSAQLAYLRVPPITLLKTGYFLNSVQTNKGAAYFYTPSRQLSPATTSIGLLCRMYLGWKHDNATLLRGVQSISTLGPSTNESSFSKNNMYYNYYATQLMHHYGGSMWTRWNEIMREYLISTQATKGHEAGSWFLKGDDLGEHTGGRLYYTALACMTLEVYYRYMPLYRDDSTNFSR